MLNTLNSFDMLTHRRDMALSCCLGAGFKLVDISNTMLIVRRGDHQYEIHILYNFYALRHTGHLEEYHYQNLGNMVRDMEDGR